MALTHGHRPENWPISPVWLGRNGILFAKGSEQRVALGVVKAHQFMTSSRARLPSPGWKIRHSVRTNSGMFPAWS